MIYAIRAVGTEYVKIGFTKEGSAQDRIKAMQTGCPHELGCIAFGPGDEWREAEIHRLLTKVGAHHRGEWFVRSKEVDRIIWDIREEGQNEGIKQELVADIPVPQAPGRLGRVLAYAQRLAADLDRAAQTQEPSVSGVEGSAG